MEIALWRNVAIIWLSLFCFIGLVIPIAILYFAVRGMSVVPGKVRPFFQKVQGYSHTLYQQSEKASTRVSEPLLRWRSRATRLQTTFRQVLPTRPPRRHVP